MLEQYRRCFYEFACEVGLCNESGEPPALVSVNPDPACDSTLIITIEDNGVPLPLPVAIDKEVRQLEKHLGGGLVFDISFGKDTTQTQFRFKPNERSD